MFRKRSLFFLVPVLALVLAISVSDSVAPGRPADARSVALSEALYNPGIRAPASPAAQAVAIPDQVNFQGVLTDPMTGAPVADGTYSVRFSIWDADTLGTELWNETQSVSVSGGLFNVQLGATTPLGSAGVFVGATPRFLEVKVGADPAMTPRLPFLSVPYAFHAGTSSVTEDVFCAGCVHSTDIGADSVTAAKVNFNYAGSTSEGGPANDSQLLDGVDSGQFLRSDTSDLYTSGTLTFNSGTGIELRNAGGTNVRLSNNGTDGD